MCLSVTHNQGDIRIKGNIGTERLGQEKKDNKGPKNTKNN